MAEEEWEDWDKRGVDGVEEGAGRKNGGKRRQRWKGLRVVREGRSGEWKKEGGKRGKRAWLKKAGWKKDTRKGTGRGKEA
jgi:hypothetical protein